MKLKWKKLLLTTWTVGILTSVPVFAANVNMNLFYHGQNHAYNAKEVKIKIDGKELIPEDMPAVIVEGRTMLPMRLIAQELGCEVAWNEDAKQAYVINDDYTLVFEIDKIEGIRNGKSFDMDVPPMIINDRTMLPVRALGEALDLSITWDDPSRTVLIGSKKEQTTQPVDRSITLNQVLVPASETAGQVFTIQANGQISDYEEIIVDDKKIVLDFYDARSGLASKLTKTNSSIVSAVRSAQHTDEQGRIYTRVVLDLNMKKKYKVTLSPDQTKLIITFDKVTVEKVAAEHRKEKDIIEIQGDGALGANVFTLSNPNRVVVDIPNVKSELKDELDLKQLKYVSAGRVGMFTDTTLRLVFEVDHLTQYSYAEEGDTLTLEFYTAAWRNMFFDEKNDVLYLNRKEAFKVNQMEISDNYLSGYTDVILPENLSEIYGNGTYEIGGDVIKQIEIFERSGKTVLRFVQNRVSVYEVTEEKDRYAIHVKNPQDVYDKVLLLDAGHGGKDPGTSGNGLVEKDLTLTMVKKIEKALKGSDIKIYLTRNSDVYPDNTTRAKTANQIADAMVSIHMNAAVVLANGTETLYQIHKNDTGNGLTSQKLAELIQNNIIAETGNTNRGIKQRTDLLILNATEVPAVIVEAVFLTNVGDALKISDTAYQDDMAEAIADAIEEAMTYRLR